MTVVTTHCAESHRGQFDPIRFPGMPDMMGMQHVFFGNTTTDNFTTLESLRAGRTTCSDSPDDLSAYWVPEIYIDGRPTTQKAAAYWKNNGVMVEAIPQGMAYIVNMDGTEWGQTVGFACTSGGGMFPMPTNCGGKGKLKFRALFPDCWDGLGLGQVNFAYSQNRKNPPGFPRRIVQLLLQIGMPDVVDGTKVEITSAMTGPDGSSVPEPYTTMHADFIMAFREAAFQQQIVDKLNSSVGKKQ